MPKARNDWANLRVYDFSYFSSYNNQLFKIVSQLHLCGEDKADEDMIGKTLFTFPTADALLAQMYRTMKFRTYCKLTLFLLLAEQQQQLLLKNNKSKPPREATACSGNTNQDAQYMEVGSPMSRGRIELPTPSRTISLITSHLALALALPINPISLVLTNVSSVVETVTCLRNTAQANVKNVVARGI
jgi:hypothetical protein